MMRTTGMLLGVTVSLVLGACSSKPVQNEAATAALPQTLAEAVESSYRTPENKQRDSFRNPQATLEFFEVQPEMSVVEIWPSGGWYTEILAPYLAEKGTYIIADPPEDPRGYTQKRVAWMEKNPDIKAKTTVSVFAPDEDREIAPANSVDRVLTFRNIHNWKGVQTQEKAFRTFYAALKPGGILGVVEHRASTSRRFDPKSGYVRENDVIRMAKKAGFELVAKSDINANSKDTKNHPRGVWTLPPTLALGETDRDKYIAIGESDRMTLKFVKPTNKK